MVIRVSYPPPWPINSVELRGLEPLTPSVQRRCSPKLSYSPICVHIIAPNGKEGNLTHKKTLIGLEISVGWEQWAILDLNQRPLPYQRSALAN